MELAPSYPVSYLTLFKTGVRLLAMFSTYENPLLWSMWLGKRNKQADMEGPFYVIGAPDRQIEKGKAVIASPGLLKKFAPFLATVRILTPDGSPIPGATIDWWQADTEGNYYFSSYTLRGRLTTDENGCAEVLSIPPGAYGPEIAKRAGHFHLCVRPSPGGVVGANCDELTTQLYVCEANDSSAMSLDLVNYMRKVRETNKVHAWSISPDSTADEGSYMNLPELPHDDIITRKRVEWWNTKLAQAGEEDLKITAGTTVEIRLSTKTTWF
ncbi:hypothetical protein M0805_005255 [Coniferiporia weirii]|nr:hypothetical protein M0805_005255 [Coniferiporia weirii]